MALPRSLVRGCLLGGAIGDALGAPVEFLGLPEIRRRYGPDGIAEFDRAYGVIGAITDDTQMTLFTAEGLLRAAMRQEHKGICYPAGVVHHAYLRWLHTQGGRSTHAMFDPEQFDGWLIRERGLHAKRAPGNTCLSALGGARVGTPEEPLNDSKGCGGVMRAAPVGLVAMPAEAYGLGREVAAVTHGHPSGHDAAAALAVMISALVHGHSLERAVWEAREALERAMEEAVALAAEGPPSPEAVERLGAGWVAEEALGIAVYCALTAGGDFARGVRLAVNHSGDSDSTGAITGNLLGAALGEEAIPKRWREGVEMARVVLALADDVWASAAGEELAWERYPGW